ncbi:MAG: hypothetical protein QXK42_04515, partial [Candidatus Korarchaeum sp.]
FSLHTYKEKERRVTLRVRDKIFEKRKKIKVIEEPPITGITKINLDEYNTQTTLIVAAHMKTKIWDLDENTSKFVPAGMAYQGDIFRKFLSGQKRATQSERVSSG